MKKLTALLLALLMVFSVAALSACKRNESSGSKTHSGESSEITEAVSAKQLFIDSLSVFSAESTKFPTTGKTDFPGMQVSLNADGTVSTDSANIDLGADINGAFDMKNNAFSVDGKLKLLGDTLDLYLGTDGEYTYLDLPGILKKAIRLSDEADPDDDYDTDDDYGTGATDSAGVSSLPLDILNNFPSAEFQAVIELAKESLEKHIKDEYFTESNKDITVNGKEYKNARVLTLSADNDMCAALLTALRDEVLLSEEMYNAMKALADLTGNTSATYEEFVANAKEDTDEDLAACEANINADVITENGKAVACESNVVIESKEHEMSIVIDSEMTADSHNIEFSVNGGEDRLYLKADGKNIEFYIISDNERIGEVKCVLNSENVWEGTLTIAPEGENDDVISVVFSFKADETEFGFNINEISVTTGGMKITLPLQLAVSFEVTETEISGDLSIKLDLTETGLPVAIDLSAEFSVEFKKAVNVSLPESFVESDEVDPEDLLDKLTEKCPNAMSLIKAIIGNAE